MSHPTSVVLGTLRLCHLADSAGQGPKTWEALSGSSKVDATSLGAS